VSGHVDGVAEACAQAQEGDSLSLAFTAPEDLMAFIAVKGSVTLDGVSLTVNRVQDEPGGGRFEVNIIPHTAERTTLGAVRSGTRVNLEIDLLARYVQRLLVKDLPAKEKP
jgi:riboflavin synthase